MAKRKLTQTRLTAHSFSPPVPTPAIAATPPSPTAVKIPFRSRKIRRLPSDPTAKKPPIDPRPPLTASGELSAALSHLRAADPLLSAVIDTHRPLSFQSPRRVPFHALSRSILYQQLAIKAAATIYDRFLSLCGGESSVLPETVLSLTPQQLRQIGVSGRKASYLHDLATKYQTGILSDDTVVAMDDESLFTSLTSVRGIGPWSVHMFMIFTLHRPDVLPVGDLSIRKGVQVLYGLKEVPSPSKVEELCEHWKPYRSVGSWYMYRLIEDKGTPVTAPAVTVAVPVAGGDAADLQQPQLVDPIQVNA